MQAILTPRRQAILFSLLVLSIALILGSFSFHGCGKDSGSTPPPECALTVQIPDGGEIWAEGDSVWIAWDAEDACGNQVAIALLHEGEQSLSISESAPNAGTYRWEVSCGAAQPGAGYTVRVRDLDSDEFDESDDDFTIISPGACALHVTGPIGGEVFRVGDNVPITWASTGVCTGPLRIDLMRQGVACLTLATAVPNTGAFAWVAARCGDALTDHTIRVTDAASGHYDECDAPFTVVSAEQCWVAVIAPNGGESWVEGQTVDVSWESTGDCGATVRVELWRAGAVCATLAAAVPPTGSFQWTAGQCGDAPDGYSIVVTDPTSEATDASDATFTILSMGPECQLAVTAPPDGDRVCAGAPLEIEWLASGDCGPDVVIELLCSDDFCATIAANTPNDGAYTWTAAQSTSQVTGYSIRVRDLESGTVDVSNGGFEILTGCAIAVETPVEGATICAGDDIGVIWHSGPCCDAHVDIQLTRNGAVCATIASGTENDGVYVWTAEGCPAGDGDYTIRIVAAETAATGESGTFAIDPCDCTLAVGHPAAAARRGRSAPPSESRGTRRIAAAHRLRSNSWAGSVCATIATSTDRAAATPAFPTCTSGLTRPAIRREA